MFSTDLARCRESGKLVEIYSNVQDTTKFDVGRVVASDDRFYVLASVSKYGKRSGFLLQEIETVIRIVEDSQYLKKMAALTRFYNEKQDEISFDRYLVFDLLEFCKAGNRIATIDIHGSGNSDAIGYIEELDIERCVVKQISDFGKNDGTCSILLEDISYVCSCSESEVMLEVLSSEWFDEMRFS